MESLLEGGGSRFGGWVFHELVLECRQGPDDESYIWRLNFILEALGNCGILDIAQIT